MLKQPPLSQDNILVLIDIDLAEQPASQQPRNLDLTYIWLQNLATVVWEIFKYKNFYVLNFCVKNFLDIVYCKMLKLACYL